MDLISVDEARDRILAAVAPLPREEVAMDAALGRVLAEDVTAGLDLPPFRSSAMDGYALVAGPGGELPVAGESATGDELRAPGEALGPGQIRNSNGVAVAAQAQVAGADVVTSQVVRDEREATLDALRAAMDTADVVCVSGGVSVGPHDHVKP